MLLKLFYEMSYWLWCIGYILFFLVFASVSAEAVSRRCSVKKMFLEISQNSQENTCVRASFFQVAGLRPATFLKRDWHRDFPVNFAKFLRTPFVTEHLR